MIIAGIIFPVQSSECSDGDKGSNDIAIILNGRNNIKYAVILPGNSCYPKPYPKGYKRQSMYKVLSLKFKIIENTKEAVIRYWTV